jgi:limonene-1,2-epoxide hydrolase
MTLNLRAAFALLSVAAGPALAFAPPPPPPATTPVADDALSRMFAWWNAAYKDPNGFTPQAFARHFTPDAVMRINGTDRARGLTDLAARFRMIQAKVDAVEIQLPFVTAFASADGTKLFTYHLEKSVENGKPGHSMVMGYAELRDGKIAFINFLSMEGQPGPIADPR